MIERLRSNYWLGASLPLLLLLTLFGLMACRPTEQVVVVTATPNLQATIEALAVRLEEGNDDPAEPPTAEPPTAVPPSEPPTTEPPTTTPVPQPPADTPINTVPVVVVSAPSSVNVRSGPDTAYPTIRVSARGSRLEVIGRSVDGEWWQVRVPDVAGGVGWVSTIYLETQNAANVPVVAAPPLPTATPTNTPPPPTATPLPTMTPSPTSTTAAPPPNNPSPSLDLSAEPYFGSHTIHPTHDTQTVDISATGGGEIDANDVAGLPGDCTGFVSSAPDVEIVLEGQTTSDLYLYFLSSSDATLIVNDPFGNWYCDDDSYGGGNPMVSFLNASNGVYDIWIGRWGSAGLTSPGSLIIGEFSP